MGPQAYFTHSNTGIKLSKQCSPSLWTLKWLAASDNTLENRINSRGEVAMPYITGKVGTRKEMWRDQAKATSEELRQWCS